MTAGMPKAQGLLLTAALLSCVAVASAGPPYVTDDPETPVHNGWEINTAYIHDRLPGQSQAQEPLFDINYGCRSNLELGVQVSVFRVNRAAGLGDTLVGVNWRFLDEDDKRPQVSVYPQVSIPTGCARRGLGAGQPSYALPLLVEKNWMKWTAFGNVGYVAQMPAGSRDYWYCGAAVTRQVSRRLELGGELFGNTPTDLGTSSFLGFNLGLAWELRDSEFLLFSAGESLRGAPTGLLYFGVQLELGQEPGAKRRTRPRHRKLFAKEQES